MKIEELKVSDLIPYENNPRKNEGAVDAVAESIRQFGFRVPIVVDKENVIIAGHTRWKSAQKLGLEVVPVIRADDLTDEQVRAFRLADNKTGELAQWDLDALDAELAELKNLDMGKFGFDFKEPEFEEPISANPSAETSFKYKEQYGVIVIVEDEAEQERVYNKLIGEGYNCRVVAT